MVELFDLPTAIKYKKGNVADKKVGQALIAEHIGALKFPALKFNEPEHARVLDPSYIRSLRGKAIKANEDKIDALICLYVAALYDQNPTNGVRFGDLIKGYIWIPKGRPATRSNTPK